MKRIPLTRGEFAKVDDADFERICARKWICSHFGYAVARNPGTKKFFWMHREVVAAPEGMDVDHIDGDRLNNTRSNLRVCTRAENLWNSRRHRDSRSVYKGVTWRKDIQRWTARIMVHGRVYHLGCFDTAEDARDAYNSRSEELHGSFGRCD